MFDFSGYTALIAVIVVLAGTCMNFKKKGLRISYQTVPLVMKESILALTTMTYYELWTHKFGEPREKLELLSDTPFM